ncbi:hypothetical protein TrVE_jg3860 [Triparma verrucosa]|uniref:SET domain-containing protein n=1 Tax=Triparma verrucosa TaxID=1606542 RepID=A0A9W7BZJ3_9STRA|nr:hypothetical protein TrVE_jg3860 [Triparma verrucosa]
MTSISANHVLVVILVAVLSKLLLDNHGYLKLTLGSLGVPLSSIPNPVASPYTSNISSTSDPLYTWASTFPGITSNAIARGYDVLSNGAKVRGVSASRPIKSGEHFIRLSLTSGFTMRTIESDPILKPILGYGSKLYNEVIVDAINAQNLEYEHPWEHAIPLALLHHFSKPKGASEYWGYLDELSKTDLSSQPAFNTPSEIFERFPELFESNESKSDWINTDHKWVEMYTIMSRRCRLHLESSYPSIFGPDILVRGESILSDENQKWASQLFYSRYWGQEFDLFDSGKTGNHGVMLPVMDSLNYGDHDNIDCGVSGGVEEGGNYFSCVAAADIEEGESLTFRYSDDTCKEVSIRSWGFYSPKMGPCREDKKPEVKRNSPPPPIKKKPRAKENDRPYVDTGDNLYDWSRTKPLINNVNDAIERGFNDVGNGLMVRGAVAARDIEAGEEYIRLELDAAINLRTIEDDPVLKNLLGFSSSYYRAVLPAAYSATNLDFTDPFEYILPMAMLYHFSLEEKAKRSSPYWGYMDELMDADLSRHPAQLSPEEVFDLFPEVFENKETRALWGRQDDNWQEAYHILARRTRRHLERAAPDIFGPHILVRGQPILSDENQKWASQLYYTHYWGEEYDLMGDGVVKQNGAMIPVMDSLNYGWNDDIECGSVDVPDENGDYYYRCMTHVPIKKGEPLVFTYSYGVCRLDAIRTWGFYHEEMPLCDGEHAGTTSGGSL